MSQLVSQTARPPSRALVIFGSLAIVCHFGAVGINALAAPSGPWPGIYERGFAPPPQFALLANQTIAPTYLHPLRLDCNYRFAGNRLETPEVYFTARLKDADGKEIAILRFPDKNANAWVRHRQSLLALGLGDDQVLPPQRGEKVAPRGEQLPSVKIWKQAPDRTMYIEEVQEHLLPRVEPIPQPSEKSILLARAYARYLCLQHGAASAEIVRHSREIVPPLAVLMGPMPSEEMIANFGELPR